MVIHQKETVEANNKHEPVAVEQQEQAQPPIRIEMNPESVPVLTAEAMDTIYEEAWGAHESGKSAMEVQHLVYSRLESRGIDPAAIVEGAVAVRFVDSEGKNDIRAVATNWQDFGTRVRNAELIPVEPQHEGQDDDDAEQERKLDLFKEELAEAVRQLRNTLPVEGVRPNLIHDLREQTEGIVRSIYNGEQVPRHLIGQLEDIAQTTRRAVMNDMPERDDARRRVMSFDAIIEEKQSEARRDFTDERSEQAGLILRKVGELTDELRNYTGRNLSYGQDVEQSVSMIARVVAEMQSSSYGHESSAHQLRSAVQNLEEAFARQQSSTRQLEPLLEELSKATR